MLKVFGILAAFLMLIACSKESELQAINYETSYMDIYLMPKKFSTRTEILEKTGLNASPIPSGYIPTRSGVWHYDSVFLLRTPDGNHPIDSEGAVQMIELYEFSNPGSIASKPKSECIHKLGKRDSGTSLEVTCDGTGTECSITTSTGGKVHIIICRGI